jgi:MutS domain V
MEPGDTSPDAEYAGRLEARRGEADRQARLYRSLGHSRAATVILIVFLIMLTEKEVTASPKALLLVPAIASVVLIVRWNRAARAHQRAVRAAIYYEGRIACLDGRWAGRGESGTRYLNENHPAALDLDLFGVGSLFELLCTACTRPGQDTLAAWLSAPAGGDEVRARQSAAAELRPRLDLHEDLIVLGSEIPDNGRLARLARFTPEGTVLSRGAQWLLATPLLSLAALTAGALFGAPTALILAALAPQAIVALRLRHYANGVLESALAARAALGPLAALLARLEGERFSSPRACELGETLHTDGRSASRLLQRLNCVLGLTAPATVLLCRPQLALAVASWRNTRGQILACWLQTLGQMEALFALATRLRENPKDVFPVVVDDGPCFEAEGLGHPFLPCERCVLNDVSLGKERRLLMVSGSNMSGKSTFLRTIGINAVLALAGAPVRATRLSLSPLIVGATLRVEDSLREGRSRFYAEALRVRQLLDLANGTIPLLFLLDEIFQGTNSRDRRVGAEAVLRRLLDRGAIGLVTTHDLTLTEIADLLSPRAANVHFADQFHDGAMAFDYRLREGVVPASNALSLLRSLGIEV